MLQNEIDEMAKHAGGRNNKIQLQEDFVKDKQKKLR